MVSFFVFIADIHIDNDFFWNLSSQEIAGLFPGYRHTSQSSSGF